MWRWKGSGIRSIRRYCAFSINPFYGLSFSSPAFTLYGYDTVCFFYGIRLGGCVVTKRFIFALFDFWFWSWWKVPQYPRALGEKWHSERFPLALFALMIIKNLYTWLAMLYYFACLTGRTRIPCDYYYASVCFAFATLWIEILSSYTKKIPTPSSVHTVRSDLTSPARMINPRCVYTRLVSGAINAGSNLEYRSGLRCPTISFIVIIHRKMFGSQFGRGTNQHLLTLGSSAGGWR